MARSGSRGVPKPYYEPALREVVARADLAMMKLLLAEAKIVKQRFGNLDLAIKDLEAALESMK